MCKYCSQWNDYKGKCDAPYWCPDKKEKDDGSENADNELVR